MARDIALLDIGFEDFLSLESAVIVVEIDMIETDQNAELQPFPNVGIFVLEDRSNRQVILFGAGFRLGWDWDMAIVGRHLERTRVKGAPAVAFYFSGEKQRRQQAKARGTRSVCQIIDPRSNT